jgi:transposase-like protein
MLTSEHYRCLNEKRNFSAEFKRESAQLVLDQNYTVAAAASAMDVGLSTMTRWVKQLRDERQGKIPKNASSWGCPHVAYEDITNIAVY